MARTIQRGGVGMRRELSCLQSPRVLELSAKPRAKLRGVDQDPRPETEPQVQGPIARQNAAKESPDFVQR